MRPTRAYVDLNVLYNNVKLIKQQMGESQLLLSVKANAYGHGIHVVSQTFQSAGADWLGVAMADEGILLRENGITIPILNLGGFFAEDAEDIVRADISQTVYDLDGLQMLEAAAMRLNKTANIHIKIETGMNRLGLSIENLSAFLDAVHQCPHICVQGVFTHFATADTLDEDFVQLQAQRFEKAVTAVKQQHGQCIVHAANSAAAFRFAQLRFNMVRCGIAAYGYNELPIPGVLPALTLKTCITHVHQINGGDTVSYGRKYTAQGTRTIATLPIGYGDGLMRYNGNNGFVLINGIKAPIVGVVCMDQCMADVTDVGTIQKGDEAVFIGTQKGAAIGANDVAGWTNTISYEVLTNLSHRVPRVYL